MIVTQYVANNPPFRKRAHVPRLLSLNLSAAEREAINALYRLATRQERAHLSSSPAFPIGLASCLCGDARTALDKRIWEFLANCVFIKCGDSKFATSIATKAIQSIVAGTPTELNFRLLAGVTGAIGFLDEQLDAVECQIARIRNRASSARHEHAAAIEAALVATETINSEIIELDSEIARLRLRALDEINDSDAWLENRLVSRRKNLGREMTRLLVPAGGLPRIGLSPRNRRALAGAMARMRLLRAAHRPLVRLARKLASGAAT